jgi:predicted GIY-YIG superfamily endonuclease
MVEIYALACRETGEIRYIGKANNAERRLSSHMIDSRRRNTPLYHWIRKHGVPELIVVQKNCADWRQTEREEIARLRAKGFSLLNVADGGDEPFCPKNVRAQNGRVNAANRSHVLWSVHRNMGDIKKWALSQGNFELAKRMDMAKSQLKDVETAARKGGFLRAIEDRLARTFKMGSHGK